MNDDDDRKNKKEKNILDMLREKREREALEQGKDPNVIEIRAIPGTDGDLPIDHPKNKAALDAFHQNGSEERPGDTLRSVFDTFADGKLPKGWRDTPIGKRAYNCGFEAGYDAAAEQYERTLDALRRILELEAQREY